MYKYLNILSIGIMLATSPQVKAVLSPNLQKPFYIGLNAGFGSTTWSGLVPLQENQNVALNISTPIKVQEGGVVYGAFAGYEFTSYFALEASYRHYPSARVTFDAFSLFAFDHEDRTYFDTDTEALNLMAKVMLTIPRSTARLYSSFGVAEVHRVDELAKQWRLGPTFGVGFNVNVTEHFMVDLGFNYTAGYGESELNPANAFIPFLYSAALGLAYRI